MERGGTGHDCDRAGCALSVSPAPVSPAPESADAKTEAERPRSVRMAQKRQQHTNLVTGSPQQAQQHPELSLSCTTPRHLTEWGVDSVRGGGGGSAECLSGGERRGGGGSGAEAPCEGSHWLGSGVGGVEAGVKVDLADPGCCPCWPGMPPQHSQYVMEYMAHQSCRT